MIRLFKHYIPKSLIILSIVEFMVLFFSVYLGGSIRFHSSVIDQIDPLFSQSIMFVAAILSCMISMGLYQRHLRDGRRGMFLRIGIAFIMGFVVLSLLFYLFPDTFVGRGIVGLSFLFGFIGIISARLLYVKAVNREDIKRRILVIGAGERSEIIDNILKRRSDRHGFRVVGYVPLPHEKTTKSPNQLIQHNAILAQMVEDLDVDEIVLAITDRRKGYPVDELLDCKMAGVEIVELQTFFERQTGRIILDILQPSWLIFSDGFSHGFLRDVIKRGFDIVASFILLSASFPVMLLAMLAIYLEDRGPIFYRQIRVGENWKLMQVMKFRSMCTDAEKSGAPQFATANDDRVTKVGHFMRKTRIDELPQLFNVLKGEMSFVGPRPERPEFVEQFTESIPFYVERHRVKPGITGWAQICYPYGASEKDTREKLQYDLYYVKNYSIFLDLTILFQTAEVILWGKGAR